MGIPVTVIASGGEPVTQVSDVAGPYVVVSSGARPVTLANGCRPVVLLNDDGAQHAPLKGTFEVTKVSITATNDAVGSALVNVGDLIFVVCGEEISLTASGATDNLGNTYTATNAGSDVGSATGRAFRSIATVAGLLTTITVAATGSSNNVVIVGAVIGGPFTAIDANPANITNDVSSPLTCPATGTLAQARELVVCWTVFNANQTVSATAPNLLAIEQNTSTLVTAAIGYQAVNATTSVAPVFTVPVNPTQCVLGTTSFKV